MPVVKRIESRFVAKRHVVKTSQHESENSNSVTSTCVIREDEISRNRGETGDVNKNEEKEILDNGNNLEYSVVC